MLTPLKYCINRHPSPNYYNWFEPDDLLLLIWFYSWLRKIPFGSLNTYLWLLIVRFSIFGLEGVFWAGKVTWLILEHHPTSLHHQANPPPPSRASTKMILHQHRNTGLDDDLCNNLLDKLHHITPPYVISATIKSCRNKIGWTWLRRTHFKSQNHKFQSKIPKYIRRFSSHDQNQMTVLQDCCLHWSAVG